MKKIFKIAIFLSVIFISSCTNFLEEDPQSVIVSESFFTTQEDVLAAVNAVYQPLYSIDANYIVLTSLESDEATRGQFGNFVYDIFDALAYDETESNFESWWRNNYRGISYANSVIENAIDVEMNDEELKARFLGEARFLRALYYFNLVVAFGDVPLITKPVTSIADIEVERTNKSVVYSQIEEDLMEAESALFETSSGEDAGRATKGAAMSLLAKVYLFQGKFEEARNKAKQVVDLGLYHLIDDYANLHIPSEKNGPEHIFSIQYLGGQENSPFGLFYGINQTGGSTVPEEDVDPSVQGQSDAAVEAKFYQDFPTGYRKDVTFTKTSFLQEDSTYYEVQPHTVKYRDPAIDDESNAQRSNNFSILRYADVLLMFAEADNEVSSAPSTEAIEAVNMILRRAQNVPVDQASEYDLPGGMSKSEFRQKVWDERKWELCFEGHRRWDLLRTNQYISVMSADGRSPVERNLIYPIPQREMDLNPKLVQNSGYE